MINILSPSGVYFVCPMLDICVFVLNKSQFMLYQIRVGLPLWIVIVRIGSLSDILSLSCVEEYTVIKNKPLYKYIGIFNESRHFLLPETTISTDSKL